MKKIFAITACMLTLSAAAYANSSNSEPNRPPKPNNPAVEKALSECRASVGDKKDRTAFDACMKNKGFERPKHPQGEKTKGVPPSDLNQPANH